MTQKTNPWAQAPEVCEKSFSTSFVPQPNIYQAQENTKTISFKTLLGDSDFPREKETKTFTSNTCKTVLFI